MYFLGSAEKFAGIFTGFYTTPTNFVEQNIEWVNPIVDLLIPQRATLFGWCVLFPAVYLLWRFCYEGKRRLWPWLALLALPLPLLHTHSALALVLFAGIRERLELEDVPESFRGTPIALVTAGILAMAFMGFSGLV